MNSPVSPSDVQCPICLLVLDKPVELHCGALVCAECCSRWVRYFEQKVPCPCCHVDTLDTSSIRTPPSVVITLLQGLFVSCSDCKGITRAENYDSHTQSGCLENTLPPVVSMQEVVSGSPHSPIVQLQSVQEAAGSIVKQLLATSPESNIVTVPTGQGKVM